MAIQRIVSTTLIPPRPIVFPAELTEDDRQWLREHAEIAGAWIFGERIDWSLIRMESQR